MFRLLAQNSSVSFQPPSQFSVNLSTNLFDTLNYKNTNYIFHSFIFYLFLYVFMSTHTPTVTQTFTYIFYNLSFHLYLWSRLRRSGVLIKSNWEIMKLSLRCFSFFFFWQVDVVHINLNVFIWNLNNAVTIP